MKKIKRKSFLVVEVLLAFLLVVILLSTLIQAPNSLYKSLKINQKKIDFFFERNILIHDLMLHLDQKKTLKNGEEIPLDKKNFQSRTAKIHYTFEPTDPCCRLECTLYLKTHEGHEDTSVAFLVVKPRKSIR